MAQIKYLLNELTTTLSSSSSSEDEFYQYVLNCSSSESSDDTIRPPKKRRKLRSRTVNHSYIIKNVNALDFKTHFRLRKESVEILINMFSTSNVMPPKTHGGRQQISHQDNILITIWYLVNEEPLRLIANRFNVCETTVFNIIIRVTKWLNSLQNIYIKWPTGRQVHNIVEGFKQKQGINGVLGAIGGTHIPIIKPAENSDDYKNKREVYSVGLQCVVDDKKKIIDVSCGCPGSMNNVRMLKNSSLYNTAETLQKSNELFPNNTFLLGNLGYPLLNWLVLPFEDNGLLTMEQIEFNYRHSATRIVVETFYKLLKARFRRLKYIEMLSVNKICQVILSCSVLHNFLLENDDYYRCDVDNVKAEEVVGNNHCSAENGYVDG